VIENELEFGGQPQGIAPTKSEDVM